MTITDDTLRTLLDLRDELGVLSVLAGFAPDHAGKPTAPIEVRNQLRQVRSTLDREPGLALDDHLGRLGDDLGGLLASGASGRGRALFLGLGSGEQVSVNVQLPFEEKVVVRDRAYVRPLVAAIDEGRPTGIAAVSNGTVRVLEWTLGITRELASMDFELGDAQLADEYRGPAGGSPGRGHSSVSHREKFEDRIDSNRKRFLKDVAATVDDLVRDRGWDRLVVAGPARVRDSFVETLNNHAEVLSADAQWESTSPGEIAQQAWPLVRSYHRGRERAMVEDIRDRANAGGTGALGVSRVCRAVNQGQVSHLLFSNDAEIEGFRAPSMGMLYAEVGGNIAQAEVELEPVPYLVEELIERVLATGGRVTRVDDDEARSGLAAYQGLGARLRW